MKVLVLHGSSQGQYEQQRLGFVVDIPQGFYDLLWPGDYKIAQLELLMVLVALARNAEEMRGRRGVWWIDNVCALMALIKGRSDQPDLDRLALLIHAAMFSLQTWIYFEWVQSKSNWSDGISRKGSESRWHKEH